jgi:thiamine biosynthesis protein ThiI
MIVCRYSEIFLKGNNRERFARRLERNVRNQLRGLKGLRVERPHGRLLVWADDRAQAVERLARCFGLVSMSPAIPAPAELEAIKQAAIEGARLEWDRRGRVGTFKVESRRQDKAFPLPSPELSRQVGGAIHQAVGIPVDVRKPDFTVGVEIGMGGRAYVFAETVPGPGGLPVGSAGRVVLMLSGGIDSPVAGYLIAKRGAELHPIYFHSFPFTGDRTKEKVVELARKLARYTGPLRLRVVGFTDVQKALREAGPPELAVVLYRRMMVRAAAVLAGDVGAEAVVSGDSLGQVASQTLTNMATIEAAVDMPVLRPLVGFDKAETIALAQRIGTFELSIAPYEDCCSLFVPKHPATRARKEEVADVEANLDVDAIARELVTASEIVEVTP